MVLTSSIHWRLADLHLVEQTGLRVFSTFACGGGSSMGYKLAGFDVIGANDIDEEMQRNYVVNLHPKHYFRCPIAELVDEAVAFPDELYDLDVLDGSPPCSTFSTAGNREADWGTEKHFREGQAKQVLDDLFFDFIRLAKVLQPKAIVAENVKGMLLGNARGYVRAVMRGMTEAGYKPQLFLVNAADCGVPQMRERVFFVALRRDIDRPPLQMDFRRPWVTAAEAIAGIQPPPDEDKSLTPKRLEVWRSILPGQGAASYFERTINRTTWFNYQKASPNHPAPTVPASSNVLWHWAEPRSFYLDELRAFSTFPTDYVFTSARRGGYLMGMSVPPFMMRDVASAVRDQWLSR